MSKIKNYIIHLLGGYTKDEHSKLSKKDQFGRGVGWMSRHIHEFMNNSKGDLNDSQKLEWILREVKVGETYFFNDEDKDI